MWGWRVLVLPFLNPMIVWSIGSYFVPFFFTFFMEFWGRWSLLGIYFFSLIGSYGDDLLLTLFSSIINNALSGSNANVLYDVYPTYRISFYIKTVLNIGAVGVAFMYYGGWKQHVEYQINLSKMAKAEAKSPFPLAL